VRVALDVTPELLAATGVARYSRELRRALSEREDCDVVPFALGRRSQPVPQGVRHLPVPLRAVHRAWSAFGFPRAEQLSGPADLVHSLDLVPPPTRVPLVITVHDLVTRELPGLHERRAAAMQAAQRAALERAAAVLAVSRSTADALIADGLPPDRLHVTPNGLTPLDPAGGRSPVPAPFVLAVGTLEPRKGHDLLLEALARCSARCEPRIVFAGPPAGRAEELRALAARLGLADRLHILGHVPDRVLAALYRDAMLLCLPSYGEGFGLPVLEAMAAGAPVLASDLPAVREVAGEAAVLFPAGEPDALAGALERMLDDGALRARLRERGLDRAAAFSWQATAQATVAAYRAALSATR